MTAAPSEPSQCTYRTVLVVEDHEDLRLMLVQLLELEGFEPVAARHGLEALARLRAMTVQPCAIITDLMMPLMDGWDLQRHLSQDVRWAHIPVIVISAVAERDRESEAVAVLQKPLDVDVLLAVLDRCAPAAAAERVGASA